MKIKDRSIGFIAFLQVIGVVVYILAFTSTVNYFSGRFSGDEFISPVIGMSMFLLCFVTSAFICSSLVLGYPLYLFLTGEKRKAVELVLWSAGWFILILLLAATVFVATQGGTRIPLSN